MKHTSLRTTNYVLRASRGFTPTPIGTWLSRCASRGIVRLRQGRVFAPVSTLSKRSAQQCPDRCRGFTLVETIVATALFTVVMLIAVGSLLSIVSVNRKAQALHLVMNNLNVALDGMVRAIRTGSNYYCGGGGYEDPQGCSGGGGETLVFFCR